MKPLARLQRELIHVGKGIERLLNAYQEGLLSIEQLRERMPGLRQREQTLRAELQAIADQPMTGLHSCAWPRRSQHSSLACAVPPKRLVSLSASALCGSWLKTF